MKKETLLTRDFTMVVLGQIISLFGNAILRFALPLYLLKETGSASLFGLVTACSFLPMILFSLLGGVMADRVNKRNIMVILDFTTAAVILIFTLVLGKLPIVPLFIVVLMLLYGIQGAYQPSVQASIPLLVKEDNLITGNAIINQVSALANLLGPVAGGVLYSLFGIKLILGVSIVCFTFSAVMEIFIKIPYQRRQDSRSAFSIVIGDLKEGYHYIKFQQPVFIKVCIAIALFNFFLSAMLIVGLPILVVSSLKMNDNLFGISQGALALGGLSGGVLAGVFGRQFKIQKSHYVLLICALSVVPIGLSMLFELPPMVSFLTITVMSFVCMAASTIFTVQVLALVQGNTPQELVGKVISFLMAMCMCASPLGQAMYGLLFERWKNNPGIVVLGAAVAACAIAVFSYYVFREFTMKNQKKN